MGVGYPFRTDPSARFAELAFGPLVGVVCPEVGLNPYPSRGWRVYVGSGGSSMLFDASPLGRLEWTGGRTVGFGGDRALPCIRPRSHDPVDDSDRSERFEKLGAGTGRGMREDDGEWDGPALGVECEDIAGRPGLTTGCEG